MVKVYDQIVVGAGINGSSTAYQLARRGREVLLLEKFPLPHSRGSSHGQSRGIRKAYPDPYFTSIMEEAYKEWSSIEKQTGVKLIQPTGLLCFTDERKNDILLEKTINAFKANPGSDYELYYGEDFKRKFPYLKMGDDGYGCLDPSGGILMADKALRAVQDLAVKFGARILDGFEVEEIRREEDRGLVSVRGTDGREFSGKSLVVCPGPWAASILDKLGIRNVPLRPIKIPVYYWREFLPHTFIYNGKLTEGENDVWGLPPFEYPNLAKICFHDGPDCDPDNRDLANTEPIKRYLTAFIRDHFPGVEPVVAVEESCMYTKTPDENPVIDFVPGTDNIIFAVGFSGTGFKLGPVTGNMLADMAMGLTTHQELEMLSLRRWSEDKPKL